jgi:electron transport complex protein RnfG
MKDSPVKASLLTALNLLIFSLLGTAVLASTFFLTRDRIRLSVEAEKLKLIAQLLPPALFDNNIIKDTLNVPPDPLLGNSDVTLAYRARLNGQPSAVVLEAVAPDGYGGKISLILSIRANSEIGGVRVVSHKETPGLGDYIELPKSEWIRSFDGKSLTTRKATEWKVKKDGGQFDYMAGATVTPRAVVKAVHKALLYFEANRDKLFAPVTFAPVTKDNVVS